MPNFEKPVTGNLNTKSVNNVNNSATPVASASGIKNTNVNPINRTDNTEKNQGINIDSIVSDEKNKDKDSEKGKKSKKDFDVHFMPQDFQGNNEVAGDKSKTTGVLIMVASFVFLVAVAGAVYYFLIKPSIENTPAVQIPVVQTPIINDVVPSVIDPVMMDDNVSSQEEMLTENPDELVEVELSVNKIAENVYLSYKERLKNSNNINDYYLAVQEFGSNKLIQVVEANKLKSDMKNIDAVKSSSPDLDGTEYIESEVKGEDIVAIKVIFIDGLTSGVIKMKLEYEEWKVEEEVWQIGNMQNENELSEEVDELISGDDDDGDGLTNAEEDLLSSNQNSADTDGDGYSDSKELLSLYNPNGDNELVDSPNISSYNDQEFGFSLIYPSAFQKDISVDQRLVGFKGSNNHKIQVHVIENIENIDLDTYYLKSFGIESLSAETRLSGENWSGIQTGNELVVYVKNEDKSDIFILSYDIGSNDVLEYLTIFKAMVNSFDIK